MSNRQLPKESSTSTIDIQPEVAVALIGLYSAAADGLGISTIEEYALTEFLGQIEIFADYTEEDFEALSKKLVSLIEQQEPDEVINHAIAALPNEAYREAAYVAAILLVGVDENVLEDEQDYLYDLQEALNISDQRAEELIDEIFPADEEEYEEDEENEEE